MPTRRWAATLRTLAKDGPGAFYAGAIGAQVVDAVAHAPASPTAMSAADLAGYRARLRLAVCGSYRAYRICGMGPPSSGGVAVLQILKMLERFDLAALGPENPVSWHLFAESQRLAYADLYRWQGDPDFVAVPVAGLVDPAYIASRSALIGPAARIAHVEAGTPAGAPPRVPRQRQRRARHHQFRRGRCPRRRRLLHLDRRAAVRLGPRRRRLRAQQRTHRLQFRARCDRGPDRQPRPARQAPAFGDVADAFARREGHVVLAIGAAGGITIVAQVAKAIIAVVDWKMSVQDAIAAPQLIAIGDRFAVEKGSRLEAMRPAFAALGHAVTAPDNPFLKLNGAEHVAGGWRGGADPRTDGRVAGY